MIRPATPQDAQHIAEIYNYYIENTIITFEEEVVSGNTMAERLARGLQAGPWYVADVDGEVCGYCYAAPFAARSAYRFSAETTVYVSHKHQRKGFGCSLYSSLIQKLREERHHCAVGLIGLPNQGSVTLHEKLGFTKVGELREVGRKFGRWVDVGFWQLLL